MEDDAKAEVKAAQDAGCPTKVVVAVALVSIAISIRRIADYYVDARR